MPNSNDEWEGIRIQRSDEHGLRADGMAVGKFEQLALGALGFENLRVADDVGIRAAVIVAVHRSSMLQSGPSPGRKEAGGRINEIGIGSGDERLEPHPM